MNDTPETDAARHDLSDYGSPVLCAWGDWVEAEFARRLERERDEARRESLEQARLLSISGEWGCKLIAQRDELQEKYDTLAVENMLEVNKLYNQRNAAMDVLSNLSHYLSCGLGDENTTAKEYGARIREGINALLDPILEEKNKLIKELKEAWLAMDEIEGTDRMNEWQNKNAHFLNIDT
jgi:hypothetical protein